MENNITKVEPKNIEIKPKAKLTIEGMVHNQEFLKKTYHDFIFDNWKGEDLQYYLQITDWGYDCCAKKAPKASFIFS